MLKLEAAPAAVARLMSIASPLLALRDHGA